MVVGVRTESDHRLLAEAAGETVSKWRFLPGEKGRERSIVFQYRFSSTPRDDDPRTRVTADLAQATITITVDPRPEFGPDAWPSKQENN